MLFPQIGDKIELILIEDCSTDGKTKEKMKAWEKKTQNANIQFVYLEKNMGLSGTRNKGVSLAKGEYLWFIDSDDVVETNTVQSILNSIQKFQPDGIVFDFYKFDGNHGECNDKEPYIDLKRSKYRSLKASTVTENKEVLLQALFDDAQMYTWCYVIKKRFWKPFPFPEGKMFEDVATIPKIMYSLNSLYYLQEPLYYYRQRENSILGSPTAESCLTMVKAIREIGKEFEVKTLKEPTRVALFTFYWKILRWSYADLYTHDLLNDKVLERYKEEEEIFYETLPWQKNVFLHRLTLNFKHKLSFWIFMHSKRLFLLLSKVG